MQQNPTYDDVVQDILTALGERVKQATACGVRKIILDVGFGFGKTVAHNYALLQSLDCLSGPQRPLLVGVSRKSMIQKVLNVSSDEALNGTTALHAWALDRGTDVAEGLTFRSCRSAGYRALNPTSSAWDLPDMELWNAISPFLTLGVQMLDLGLVALIVYWLYRLTKGTSAIPIFLGLLAIYLIWKVVTLMGMRFLGEILGQFIGVGILAIIIVFQQELRQFLFSIGDRASFKQPPAWLTNLLPQRHAENRVSLPVEEIVRALEGLSKRKEGALIIIQRSSDLSIQIQSSTKLVADIYAPLIEAIFHRIAACTTVGSTSQWGAFEASVACFPSARATTCLWSSACDSGQPWACPKEPMP